MVKWEDKKKRYDDPTIVSSTARVGMFRLSVHHHIYFPDDVWVATCYGMFEKVELKSKDLEEAKCQAVAKMQVVLEEAIDKIIK